MIRLNPMPRLPQSRSIAAIVRQPQLCMCARLPCPLLLLSCQRQETRGDGGEPGGQKRWPSSTTELEKRKGEVDQPSWMTWPARNIEPLRTVNERVSGPPHVLDDGSRPRRHTPPVLSTVLAVWPEGDGNVRRTDAILGGTADGRNGRSFSLEHQHPIATPFKNKF